MDIFKHDVIRPFEAFGLTGKFWAVHIDTLVFTWIAMGVIGGLILLGRYFLQRQPEGLVAVTYEKAIGLLIDMCNDSFRVFNYRYFVFITTIFFFTFFCCLIGVALPYCEESTRDFNTTFALGLTSFLFVQLQKIKVHGILGYLKEFIEPTFILAPVHVIGELSKIASMSFRLFGNIIGGSTIIGMVIGGFETYKIPFLGYVAAALCIMALFKVTALDSRAGFTQSFYTIISFSIFLIAWLQICLGIGEGLIQSFVLTMLTMTYLSIGVQHDEDNHEASHTNDKKILEGI